MIKFKSPDSTARVLIGLAFLTAASISVAGCSTTASASPTSGSGNSATSVEASSNTSTSPSNVAPTTASTTPTAGSPQAPAPSQSAATTSGAAASPGRCHTSDLSASYDVVTGSAAAGSISYNLRLTNTSMHQCTIYGYAGMLLLNAQHQPLPTNLQRDALVPKQLLRLNPGGSAAATVRFSPDVPGTGDNMSPGQACQPTANFTEVTPPDETTQLVTAVAPPTSVCERGTMAISAFVAGRTGPNQ